MYKIFLITLILCLFFGFSISLKAKPLAFNKNIESYIGPDTMANVYAGFASISENESTSNTAALSPDSVFDKLELAGKYVDILMSDNLQELPVGVKKKIGNITYTVAFTRAKLHPKYAALSVMAKIQIPQRNGQTGQPITLFFGAQDIKYAYSGGIIGDARLVLLADINIPFNNNKWALELKGSLDQATGNFGDLSYVDIDCEGFKELSISAALVFSRDMLIPLNAQLDTIMDPTQRVKGHFKTIVRDWNDLLVQTSISPFALRGQHKFAFTINNAVFDFSDQRNSALMSFPPSYDQLIDANNRPLWRGVYVQSLQVVLPPEFKKKDTENRISFAAQNLIIDNFGVSGDFSASNILPLAQGDASGWAFSVDTLMLRLEVNQLRAGSFAGKLKLPVSQKTELRYSASISPDNYLIAVALDKPMDFSLWRANMHLASGSSVVMSVENKRFRPKAILNGYMSVSINSDTTAAKDTINDKSRIPKITFQALTIQTQQPYFQVGAMGYQGQSMLANFPISITHLEVKTTGEDIELRLGIGLNLVENKFGATGSVGIFGKISQSSGLQRWRYDKVALNGLGVDADFGAFSIKGNIEIMRNDPVYGNGFSAGAELKVKSMGPMVIQARTIFGSVNYRYWMVDGSVNGLNVQIAPVTLTGFGGGASERMARKSGSDVINTSYQNATMSYQPDSTLGLAFKAAVFFNVGQKNLLQGNLAFEMVFNQNGGLNKMGLFGKANVMAKLDLPEMSGVASLKAGLKSITDKEAEFLAANANNKYVLKMMSYSEKAKKFSFPATGENGSINAQMGIEYDFQTKVLHSTAEMFVSLAGGALKGRGLANSAGYAVLHIAPGTWYMHIGTPQNRLGLSLKLGPISANSGGYFMMGDNMPASTPVPPAVTNILGIAASQTNNRQTDALSAGRGLAFGTNLNVSTGDLNFLIFYAAFQAGAGYDIMLLDMGPNARCSGSSQPIGINGWYASGQAYTYLQGELGVQVKLFEKSRKIPVIKGAAAVLLQAKGPNPSWFAGQLAGNYNLLAGTVKGAFRFKIELGQECQIINAGSSALAGLDVISDISPSESATNVDVFAAPQAAFNMKIDRSFELEEESGIKNYLIKLDKFVITKAGQPIVGTLEWNENKDIVSFRSFEILPSQTQLIASVKIAFYQINNGVQTPVYVDNVLATEEKTVSFKTGTAPTSIPLSNIAQCYPVINQQNYYVSERNNGYVLLKQGQDYLFDAANTYRGIFVSSTDSLAVPLSYQTAQKRVSFALPQLSPNKDYRFVINAIPVVASQSTASQSAQQVNIGSTDNANTLQVNKTTITGTASNAGASAELLNYNLRSSQYPSFGAKIQSLIVSNNNIDKPSGTSDIVMLGANVNSNEPFDIVELIGNQYSASQPMIGISAMLEDAYYTNQISPLIYHQSYSIAGIGISRRNTSLLGAPPLRALTMSNSYRVAAEQNNQLEMRKTRFPFSYDLAQIYKQDHVEMQTKVSTLITNGTANTSVFTNLLTLPFPLMSRGFYKIRLQYRFPDGSLGSSGIFQYFCPIN